ncbi:helix-turn-helix domain-containing protein [Amycolatopsis jejuensis]|uniref:helix-turn-helix domain-containing protein n=1 Tax=Amycolatopsis jejuensis TaxID=330084 RepID=UPI0005248D17|nr:helix-turn-helix domain-containing protein [Amycolatopsis jejuensis]
MSTALVEAVEKLTDRISRLEKAAKAPVRVAWRPREVAQMTGLSYKQVLELIHEGLLGAVQDGRLHVVPDVELQRYLARGVTAA